MCVLFVQCRVKKVMLVSLVLLCCPIELLLIIIVVAVILAHSPTRFHYLSLLF